MTSESLIDRHASTLAARLDTTPATDLSTLREQVAQAAEAAPDGVAQSYATAAMYLDEHDRQPLRTRPAMLQYADDHLNDALTATS